MSLKASLLIKIEDRQLYCKMVEEDDERFIRICEACFGAAGEGCTLNDFLKLKETKQNELIDKVEKLADNAFLEGMIKKAAAAQQPVPQPAPSSAMGMGGMWQPGSFPFGIGGPAGMSIAALAKGSAASAASGLFPPDSTSQGKRFARHATKGKQR